MLYCIHKINAFIFAFDMGVAGAALATVFSQVVAALYVLNFLTGKGAILRLKKECFRLEKKRVRSIVSLGVPSFVMQGSNCLV